MVAVQLSPALKSVSGFKVKVAGPPLTVAVCAPLVAHEMLYQAPDTVTGSLKVTVMLLASATLVAPLVGTVLATVGGRSLAPQLLAGELALRGCRAAPDNTSKSLPLLSVSWHPSDLRTPPCWLVRPTPLLMVTPPSALLEVPQAAKSTIFACGKAHGVAVAPHPRAVAMFAGGIGLPNPCAFIVQRVDENRRCRGALVRQHLIPGRRELHGSHTRINDRASAQICRGCPGCGTLACAKGAVGKPPVVSEIDLCARGDIGEQDEGELVWVVSVVSDNSDIACRKRGRLWRSRRGCGQRREGEGHGQDQQSDKTRRCVEGCMGALSFERGMGMGRGAGRGMIVHCGANGK
jgi:hypothetical protein